MKMRERRGGGGGGGGGRPFYEYDWQLKGLPGSRRAAKKKICNYSELYALYHIYPAKIKQKKTKSI